jgi:hypothetical protein
MECTIVSLLVHSHYLIIACLSHLLQVWIVGEKLGEGIGRTRKEALCQASEISLRNLASKFVFSVWASFKFLITDTT